jgi:outer membrane protein assembly factor BamB
MLVAILSDRRGRPDRAWRLAPMARAGSEGLSKETALSRQWPAGGPPVVWSAANLGAGYGSLSVSGDRVFVQGCGTPRASCPALNRADGKLAWVRILGPGDGQRSWPLVPAGQPTVDGDRLYVLSESGDLAALRFQDGSVLWQRNILKEFGARNIPWLISESPLVDGNQLIVTPGGRNAGIVALDKLTGKTIWASKELSDEAGYASAVVADVQGVGRS